MNESISRIINHRAFIPSVVGVVSFGAGTGLGYILGKRNGDVFDVILDEETAVPELPFGLDMDKVINRDFDVEVTPDGEVKLDYVDETSPEAKEIVDNFIKQNLSGDSHNEEPVDLKAANPGIGVIVVEPEATTELEGNVFDDSVAEDVAEEEKHQAQIPTADGPYVISRDDYFSSETGLRQETLTYYAGDDTLTGENDEPIYDIGPTIGAKLFGLGSGDPKVFYVRNEKKKAEYEVIHHSGHYAIEVQGMDAEAELDADELRHSNRLGKFKDD